MPRPYNKKTINDAALICAVMASQGDDPYPPSVVVADLGIRETETSVRLAEEACEAVFVATGQMYPEAWCEAENLIRSGWRIGDPITLLPVQTVFVEIEEHAASLEYEDFEDESPEEHAASLEYEDLDDADEAPEYGIAGAPLATEPAPAGEPGDYGADS